MKKLIFLNVLLLLYAVPGFAQTAVDKGLDAITESAIKGQLRFLASDWTEGRAVGTKGAYMAADYIASVFEIYGIQPFGDMENTRPSRSEWMKGVRQEAFRTYYQNFSMLQYTPGKKQSFSIVTKNEESEMAVEFNYETDFYVRTGTVGQMAKAPLVFAGYGFKDDIIPITI